MTIPDIGHCAGSGAHPIDGTTLGGEDATTAVCGACSGRFELRSDGTVSLHAAAGIDDRESREEADNDGPPK
jgi:hypothetical protein